nr:hypothetical protein Cplu_448 [Cedratvirus plubellavi]
MQNRLTEDIDCISVNVDDLPFTFISGLSNKLERLYLARKEEKERISELEEFVSLFRVENVPDNLQRHFNLLPEDARRELEFLSERYDSLDLNKGEESIAWVDNAEGITNFYGSFDEDTINSLMEKIVVSGIPYKDCTVRWSPRKTISPKTSPLSSASPQLSLAKLSSIPRLGLRRQVEEEF